jgi:hypothetical protein
MHNSIYWRSILVLFLPVFALACASSESSRSVKPATPVTTDSPIPINLTADSIIQSLKAGGLPIKNEVVFTDENDPNKLLGRPNQYVGKASWNDERDKDANPKDPNCTVEVFDSIDAFERRKEYLEGVAKAPMFAQYVFSHKNAVLRLDHALTPKQAAEYEKVLKAL